MGRDADAPGEVLIITGPAAAGKTTVAQRVAEASTEPSVHLHADDFFKALKTGRRRGWMSGAEPQHEVVFEAIGAAAGVYATGGYFVVIDTLARTPFLDRLVETVRRSGVPVHLVVLRPTFDQVLIRSRLRDAKARHAEDVLCWLYKHFDDLGDLEEHVIDNSDQEPDQTVEAIETKVRSGASRLGPSKSDEKVRVALPCLDLSCCSSGLLRPTPSAPVAKPNELAGRLALPVVHLEADYWRTVESERIESTPEEWSQCHHQLISRDA